MAHKWTEDTEPGPTNDNQLYASLAPEGRLALARKTHEALGSPDQIVVLYDDETDSIGLRPAPSGAVNAYPLRTQRNFSGRVTSLGRFLRRRDLRLDQTCRFPQAHIDDGVLVLDLHTRVPVHPGSRSAAYRQRGRK